MSLISTTIPNLVNGVSQQPATIRLATQAQAQVNGVSNVATGLSKRPPTQHVARLSSSPMLGAFIHTINRSTSERYQVIIAGGNLRVFDLSGAEKTVSFPSGKGYLASATPAVSFRATTVDDYTFIVNREIVTGIGNSLSPSRPYEALIWIKQGGYGISYSVTLNGKVSSYTGPTSDTSKDSNNYLHIDTSYIAGMLFQQIVSNNPALSVQQFGSTIYVSSSNDFSVSVSDGLGDSATSLIKGKVQRFTDLPARAVAGFVCEVAPNTTSAGDSTQDAYWVTYSADAKNPYGGTWGECPKPGENIDFDATLAPYTLVRNGDGTFTFGPATWTSRQVGSLDVIPMPSFVGGTINGVFFHRNRLGFISGENVIFSAAGDFFNFFRASAIQLLDSDVIDISVSNTKVSVLNHVLPFNETLLLFSDQTQFRLNATDLLTPKTVSVNTTTEYPCSGIAAPVGAGQNIYFTYDRGDWTGVREYYVDATSKTSDATDITSHVPAYINGNARQIAACPDENMLMVLSAADRTTVWVYNYYWVGQQKMQSSWHKWQFPAADSVLAVTFLQSDLYMVISRPFGTFLERMNLAPGAADAPLDFEIALDRRVTEATAVAQTTDGKSTAVTIPYVLNTSDTYYFVSGFSPEAGTVPAGRVLPYTLGRNADGSADLTVPVYCTHWFFGRAYEFRYRFSDFQVRDSSGQSNNPAPITSGRLQVRNLMLNHTDSAAYQVEVTPDQRDAAITNFTGPQLGQASIAAGLQTSEGRFRVSVQSKNDQVTIDIVNATHLPCTFTSAEWEGFFTLRSKRM